MLCLILLDSFVDVGVGEEGVRYFVLRLRLILFLSHCQMSFVICLFICLSSLKETKTKEGVEKKRVQPVHLPSGYTQPGGGRALLPPSGYRTPEREGKREVQLLHWRCSSLHPMAESC